MTKLSVIIPVFNDAAFIGEALRSVFDQTRLPDEVVVVDDGSTDGSPDIVRGFLPAVTLVSQANQGIGTARNTGLAEATGDVIAFLDADDIWPADSLERRLERLEADSMLDGAYGLVEHFISPEVDAATRAKYRCPEGRTAVRFAGSMLLRRRTFDRIGVFDPKLRVGEMIDWVARLNDSGGAMAPVDALVMRRRIHGGNTVVSEQFNHGDYLKALRASLTRKAAARKLD